MLIGGVLGLLLLLVALSMMPSIVPSLLSSHTTQNAQDLYNQATSGSPAFNDPLTSQGANHWVTVGTEDQGYHSTFTEGGVHVSTLQPGILAGCLAAQTNFSNFAFQVQMTILEGEGGGLLFRQQDNSYGYRFFVGQKKYDLNYDNKSITINYAGFKASLNRTYLLTVIAFGSSISLYVDKQLLATVEDRTTSSGAIGFMAWSGESPAEVVYTSAKVWTL